MAEFVVALLEIWMELRRVPTWAWWVMMNLAAVAAYAVMQVPELRSHGNSAARRAVWFMVVVVLAWAGALVVAVLAAGRKLEDAITNALEDIGSGPRDADEWP